MIAIKSIKDLLKSHSKKTNRLCSQSFIQLRINRTSVALNPYMLSFYISIQLSNIFFFLICSQIDKPYLRHTSHQMQ